ncbi:hypothetical protein L2U69_00135 [Zavarzinia compransoris]|uniref:hypothetical protein n=1 Tax=Zavarzinia marina TaxID=2911065 RepID=UPI001F2DAEA5|nr:hypothetical protein [Zavarzinia marina]MCF4164050.1 hypothetical protein [Zavarzinia marina]
MGAIERLKGGLFRLAAGALVAGAALTGPTMTGAGGAKADIIQWSDTFAALRYGIDYQEPANPKDVAKIIFQLGHTHGWTYGTTFMNLDVLAGLSKNEEASKDGSKAAKEIYFVFRETLSSSKIFGAEYGGIIRDIGLTFGTDLSYKDAAFNARVRKFVIGPTIDFDVPGFANIGLQAYFEHNYNGILNQPDDFDPTWRVAGAWGIPFEVGLPFKFKGFFTVTGEKGDNGFGQATAIEYLVESALLADIGPNLGAEKGHFYLGLGYQWWKNKFGNDPKFTAVGTEASVPQLVVEFHW